MKIELIDSSRDAINTISRCAGVCYGKDNSSKKRIKNLKEHKHLATMRFAHAVFKVSDISIACQNQLVRSKHLDFLVESKRYVDASTRGFVYPSNISSLNKSKITKHINEARELYKALTFSGVTKENARSILPANTMTTACIAGNFQAWMDFLKLRVSKHAQYEIRHMAIEIWKQLASNFPEVFEDLILEDKDLTTWILEESEPLKKD